jgi:hypothetical protein
MKRRRASETARGPVASFLAGDHVRLDALLRRATAPRAIDEAAYAEFRAGLLRHIGMEEKILLPAAHSAPAAAGRWRAPPGCGSTTAP